MKSASSFLFLLVVFFSLLTGCKKYYCNQEEVAYLTLSQEDLKIDPYSGKETLVFKNLNGELIKLNNGTRYSTTDTRFEYAQEYANEYHDGCKGDYYTKESDYLGLQSLNDSNSIMINLGYSYTFDYPDTEKKIMLFFDTQDSKGWCFLGSYKFRHDSILGNHTGGDSVVAYHDKVTIGPKTFNNVVELYTHCPSPRAVEWFCTAYYSVTEGFVGIRSNLGKLWYLDARL